MYHKRPLQDVRRVHQGDSIPLQVLVGRTGDTGPHVVGAYVEMVGTKGGVPVRVAVYHMGHHLGSDGGSHLYAGLQVGHRLPVCCATRGYKEEGRKHWVLEVEGGERRT